MKLEDIRTIAKSYSIKTSRLSKSELIRSIQTGEGNFACFATANAGVCDQSSCLWRKHCFATAQR